MIATFSSLGLNAAGAVRRECTFPERQHRKRKKRKVRMIDVRISANINLIKANMQTIAFEFDDWSMNQSF